MHLAFEHVSKLYGPVIGLNDFCCRIGPGITGLFGSNGAGKSTMMKLASGQLRPSQGRVMIGEHSAWSTAAKRNLGYSPDTDSFYESMTGRAFVTTMTRLYGYSARESRERAEKAIADVGMTDRADRKIAGCSHGMRQRIKLAQAMVHDPAVLLLDEPMTGIDPGGRREFKQLLERLAGEGKAVLVSTHILDEIEDLADQILMVARGRLVASGTINDIRNLIADEPFSVEIVAEPARQLAAALMAFGVVLSVAIRGDTLTVRTTNQMEFFGQLGKIGAEGNIAIRKLEVLDAGAEAVFGYLAGGRGA